MRTLTLLVACAFVTGCARGPEFASVAGVVKLDGKPLADAEVQFIPDVTAGANGPSASAYTDQEGRYQIVATHKTGVVVGKNRICVNDARVMMPGGSAGIDVESGVVPAGGQMKSRRVRVPALYSDATRSPFGVVEIRPGVNDQNFEMKSYP